MAVSAPWPRWHGTSLSYMGVSLLPCLWRKLVRTVETVFLDRHSDSALFIAVVLGDLPSGIPTPQR